MPPLWTDGRTEQAQPVAGPRPAAPGRHAARLWFYRLIGERPRLWARFAQHYEQLRRLPRRARRRVDRKVAFGLTGVALLLALSQAPVHATTITVANGEVTINDNNICSLREAIINANTDSQVHNDCVAGSLDDVILLPGNSNFVINNSHTDYYGPTGLPVINSFVIIDGNGSTISRPNSAPDFRFFAVGAGGDLTLSRVTLQRGRVANQNGGAILVDQGTLILTHTTITESHATGTGNGGAIANINGTVFVTNDNAITDNVAGVRGGGIFSVIDANGPAGSGYVGIDFSTVSGNSAEIGGGIAIYEGDNADYEPGEEPDILFVSDATISGNSADCGGGLSLDRHYATTRINASTISDNSATDCGGGIYIDFPDTAIVKITNSTISGNSAGDSGGGIKNEEAQLIIENSTVMGNSAGDEGGGLWRNGGGTISVDRSIVSGNTAPIGPEGYSDPYIAIHSSFSIFGHSGNAGLHNDIVDPTDIVPAQPLAQILNPTLQNLGGWTEVHGLPGGSPAIDRAPNADCLAAPVNGIDQRGESRNSDGQLFDPSDHECDIGAVERHLPNIQISTGVAPAILNYIVDSPYELLDGRREGLPAAARFDAIDVPNPEGETAHFSFLKPTRVPGLGRVPAQDIVTFNGNTFALAFDGSDVALTTTGENIDAVSFLDGEASPIGEACRAYLLISTKGAGSVTGHDGRTLRFRGEDLLGFCATELGYTTRGQWHLAFDGSAEGLPLNALTNLAALDNGQAFFFMTTGTFRADGVSGRSGMVYRFDADTGLITGPYWAAADVGLTETLSGLSISGDLLLEDRR